MKEFIFAYGSLLNKTSRERTFHTASIYKANIKKNSGYYRTFNFRSNTGFTALGLAKLSDESKCIGTTINGIIIEVENVHDFQKLDDREVGYNRIDITEFVEVIHDKNNNSNDDDDIGDTKKNEITTSLNTNMKIWVYIPSIVNRKNADKDYPICQTYVDTVLEGCIDFGEKFTDEWILSTAGWSQFYLYDTPTSRRPWLSRPMEWKRIDRILMKFTKHTYFIERRHPEEFSAHWLLLSLRGMWGVPSRHTQFIGREKELDRIGEALKFSSNNNFGLTLIETVGIGGVGKTQLAIEFCYRNYDASLISEKKKQKYGLIVWIDAQSESSVSKSFHDLAVDAGIKGVDTMDQKQIVQEIKGKLYRTQCPWLLIFDNFEPWDHQNPMKLLNNYIPNGSVDSNNVGHILVTSRVLLPGFDENNSIRLGCFQSDESINFLKLTCGVNEVTNDITSSIELANVLGHLPLALAIAAAYMRRCDLSCREYLNLLKQSHRVVFTEESYLRNYSIGLGASLSLSIAKVGELSKRVLHNISYLAPDDITKEILQKIIFFDNKILIDDINNDDSDVSLGNNNNNNNNSIITKIVNNNNTIILLAGIAACVGMYFTSKQAASMNSNLNLSNQNRLLLSIGVGAGSATVVAATAAAAMKSKNKNNKLKNKDGITQLYDTVTNTTSSAAVAVSPDGIDVMMTTNEIWANLKTFSMLTVRQHNTSSIHRLLQSLLRTSQTNIEQEKSIYCCYKSIHSLWIFNPSKTVTWKEAGKILAHAKSICMYICTPKLQTKLQFSISLKVDAATLLCECALYMSMVLSHFHAALSLLDIACGTLEDIPLKKDHDEANVKNALARAYLTRGKVARYCGEYDNSDENMKRALSYATSVFDISAIYHEIGVLALKKDNFKHAKMALIKSLNLKTKCKTKRIQNNNNKQEEEEEEEESDSIVLAFSDESATLHQLAVVNLKENNLSEAEKFFRSALSVDSEAGSGGRAATLRQLARVLDRRGKLKDALQCLQDARQIYDAIYGKGNSLHVNVSGIECQLGIVHYRLDQFKESEQHFEAALAIQKKLHGNNDIDVANTYGEIGKMEIRRGNASKAYQNVLKQKDIITDLLATTIKNNNLNEIKLKQKLLAVTLLIRRWSTKYKELMDQEKVLNLNNEITNLQSELNCIKRKNTKQKRDYETNVLMKSKIAEKIKIPPDKLFLNDRAYSEFDDNGFPIKDHNGQVLTKSKIKRLKKLLIQHKKRHLKWKGKK